MSVVNNPFLCDGCGKRREKDTNRWWILWEWNYPLESGDQRINLAIVPWSHNDAIVQGRLHACGVNCLMLLCERFATTGRLERPRPIELGVVKH